MIFVTCIGGIQGRYTDTGCPVAGSTAASAAYKAVHVISIARANNIAIMLTQFSAWSDEEVRAAVLDDGRLSADKLSLLLQVSNCRLARARP